LKLLDFSSQIRPTVAENNRSRVPPLSILHWSV
jgi:hypothetical protein